MQLVLKQSNILGNTLICFFFQELGEKIDSHVCTANMQSVSLARHRDWKQGETSRLDLFKGKKKIPLPTL